MLAGERRPVSGRRGMTVLGKVPKPVNLPSQRLENRGLDPNVEIVPRGSVSWGTAGSPPTSASPWGNSTQSSSPPVSSGPWGGVPPRPSTAGSSGTAAASSVSSTVSGGGPWGGHPPRPSSAGSGARPSSAGSLRQAQAQAQAQVQETVAPANAWGPSTARPSSASGVLGQAQPQSPAARPRSAETRTPPTQAPALTRFAEQTNGPAAPSPGAWGGAGAARKLGEEPHQPARFTLTRVDFPTLGSEKNPDLRPQQNKTGGTQGDRSASLDERVPPLEERSPSGPSRPYEEPPPTSPGAYGGQERMLDGWRRGEARPHGGHPGMEGNWHRDGPAPMQPFGGGQPQAAETWRREPGHGAAPGGGPSDDNWRRGGPPVGPYGPPGPGRFVPDPGFMHQQRYGPAPGPGPYGRPSGGPGPGGYGRHGDMYGNTGPFGRPGGAAPPRPGPPMGPGMYQQGPAPYDNYYGPPGPGYGNMDDREMMMLGMNGPPGMYGNFPQGPPVEGFGRYPHGGPGPGPRHMPNNMGINRERNESMGYEGEGYREGPKYKDNANFKDGAGYKDGFNKEGGPYKEGGRMSSYQDPGESRRAGHVMSSNLTSETQRPSSRGGHHGSHRDWGAAASSDEPMDFSKPVFEEDVSSASPGPFNKTSSSSEPGLDSDAIKPGSESKPGDHFKTEDSPEVPTEKVLDSGEAKDSDGVQASKSSGISEVDHVQMRKHKEVESGGSVLKGRVEDSLVEVKDQLGKKVQGSEGSESSEKRWGRAQMRERSFGREPVSSSHSARAVGSKKDANPTASGVAVPAATTALRPGLHGSGRSYSRPTTPNVTQASISTTAESLVREEVVSPPVEEKYMQSSDPTSPCGSDGQKSSDKVRILKRAGDGPDSPHGDTLNITETAPTEVPISSMTAEALVKEDTKPKSKALNNHDGEKEWRPKVLPVADAATEVPRPSSAAAHPKLSTSRPSSSGGPTGSAEKAGLDAGNPSNDSYDYEAQRARMKEIAAQRAIQLRKEEDERIKEQKARASAKLEELNRRSLVTSVSPPAEEAALSEPAEEPAPVIVQAEEAEVVISEVVVEEVQVVEISGNGTGVATSRGGVRNGRNEHGKRERVGDRKRDRAEHRMKMGPGEQRELAKARMTSLSSHVKTEAPLLPSPSQQAPTTQASPLSTSAGYSIPVQQDVGVPSSETSVSLGTQVQQQLPPKVHEARHRGKQSASQLKQVARHLPQPLEAEAPVQGQVATPDSTEQMGGWNGPLDLDPKDVTLSLGSMGVTSESGAAARKKKTKNSGRNKHKLEGLTVSTDSTATVDLNQGWNIDLSSSNDSGPEIGKPTPKAVPIGGGDDVVKAVPSSVLQKDLVPQDVKAETVAGEQAIPTEIAGNDGGSVRSNGELPGRRPQRKSQLARERRVPARERGTSQDVRVGDKPHGGEGMIWAPVRSPSGTHPAGSRGGFGSDGIASADTAIVEKKEESVVAPQTGGRARRAELERYTPKPVVKQQAQQQQEEMQQQQQAPSSVLQQNQGNESANVSATPEVLQNSSSLSEIKFGSEARQADISSKQSRAHASWRQRTLGTERVSAHKETNQVQHSEPLETGGKSQQPSFNNNNNTQQQTYHRSRPSSASSEQSRPGSSHQGREGGRNHPSTSVGEKEQQNLEIPQLGRSSHSQLPAAAPAATERELKNTQEGVTPYQPPRPGSSQRNRGLESEVQSSHEHVRSHRTNISQVDRQHGAPGKFDRDHHGSHERGPGHQQSRSQSFRHQHSSHDRDQSQVHSGSHQQTRSGPPVQQPSAPEGASKTQEKDQQNSHAGGAGQGKSASQSLHEKRVPTEREQSHVDHQQTRSPPRQRIKQQAAAAHEREQAPAAHVHQQSRYRQPGHEKDHQREVPNAVHHHQHQRGTSDGHWQQTGGAPPERAHPHTELGHSNEQQNTRSTVHKSQVVSGGSVDKDHPPSYSSFHQHPTRSETQNKPHGPAQNDTQKQQPHYQPVSQHQRPQQQGSQGPKVDNAHNNAHWNGERAGSPPVLRGREHGHSRRGRVGRYSGPGRGGDIENRREQLPKQRLPIDSAGGAVPSQVGG